MHAPKEVSVSDLILRISVSRVRFVSGFPDGVDELWCADIQVARGDGLYEMFEDILYVESNGVAYIYGIEFEDGLPRGLRSDLAQVQQRFIQFLRDETARKNMMFPLSLLFTGHDYSSEWSATEAYVAERSVALKIGIGYRDKVGVYQRLAMEYSEDD